MNAVTSVLKNKDMPKKTEQVLDCLEHATSDSERKASGKSIFSTCMNPEMDVFDSVKTAAKNREKLPEPKKDTQIDERWAKREEELKKAKANEKPLSEEEKAALQA